MISLAVTAARSAASSCNPRHSLHSEIPGDAMKFFENRRDMQKDDIGISSGLYRKHETGVIHAASSSRPWLGRTHS